MQGAISFATYLDVQDQLDFTLWFDMESINCLEFIIWCKSMADRDKIKAGSQWIYQISWLLVFVWSTKFRNSQDCGLSMWGKIIIPMYRLWSHGLYGPRCPLSPERPLNLSLTYLHGKIWSVFNWMFEVIFCFGNSMFPKIVFVSFCTSSQKRVLQ